MAHTKHTPGKAVKYEQFLVKVFSENGNMTLIADTCVSSTIPQDEAEANADRIVKCWNELDIMYALNQEGWEKANRFLQERDALKEETERLKYVLEYVKRVIEKENIQDYFDTSLILKALSQ